MKRLSVPSDLPVNDMSAQVQFIQDKILMHYHEHTGYLKLFGPITGYKYRFCYDDHMDFSVDGKLINPHAGRFPEGVAQMSVGGRPIIG